MSLHSMMNSYYRLQIAIEIAIGLLYSYIRVNYEVSLTKNGSSIKK